MKRILIIAKCYKKDVSGPANIIRGLIRQFDKESINYKALLLEEGMDKVSYLTSIVQELKKKDKSVVNVHTDGFLLPLFILLMSKIYRKHSYYLTVHGIYRIDKGKRAQWKYVMLEKYIYRHFNNIICVSEMLKDDLEELYKRKKNVYVIPNATDADSNKGFEEKKVKEIVSLTFFWCIIKRGLRKKIVFWITIVSIYCMLNICINQVHFNNILFSVIYTLPFFMMGYEMEYLISDKKVVDEIVFSMKNWIIIEGMSVILFALTHISTVRSYGDMDWVTGTLGSYQCNVLMTICSFSLLVFWTEYNDKKKSVMWIIISGILAISTGAVGYTLVFACVILMVILLSFQIKIPQKLLMVVILTLGAVAFIQIVPKWMSNEIVLLSDKNYLYNRVTKIRYYENTFIELPKNEGFYEAVFGTGLGEYSSRAAETCAGGYIPLYDKIAPPFESTIRKKYISSWNFGGDGLTSTAQASVISIQGELGVIGLITLFIFLFKKMRSSTDVRGKIVVLYFIGLLFLDNTLEFAKYGLVFWMAYYLCNRMVNKT